MSATDLANQVTSMFESYVPLGWQGQDVLFPDIAQDVMGFGGFWCDFAVSSVFRMCDMPQAIGGFFGYTPYHFNWFMQAGCLVPKSEGRRGDVPFFQWNRQDYGNVDHVGMLRGPLTRSGLYPTVEGDTTYNGGAWEGGAAALRLRDPRDIRAIFRPKYPNLPATPKFRWIGRGVQGGSVKTVQRALRTTEDGCFGPNDYGVLKAWQRSKGWKQTGYLNEAAYKVLVGGVVPVQGSPSPVVAPNPTSNGAGQHLGDHLSHGKNGDTMLLQHRIGTAADDDFGYNSNKALEHTFGCPEDGVISAPDSQVIRKMQMYLNGYVGAGWCGYGHLSVDGSFGQATARALSDYMRAGHGEFHGANRA